MKMNKKKIAAVAAILCIVAILSIGSLAWFTDTDSVVNTLKFATDEDTGNTDFSVDVYEMEGDTKTDTGRIYEKLEPGQWVEKTPWIKNDGKYNEYVRVSVTVNNAEVWKQVVTEGTDLATIFTGFDSTLWTLAGTSENSDADTITYSYYCSIPLVPDQAVAIFNGVTIPGELTKEQATAMNSAFSITVHADAIQADNLPSGVTDAAGAFAIFDAAED